MSQQNTPRPNKRQPRNPNRSNPPTPEGTFALRNPSPNTNLLRPQSYYHQPYPNQPYRNPAPAPQQHGFYGYGSQPNAFQDFSSQPSSFPFSHQDYASQTQMGGSSSQPRTDQVHSPINAFSLEDLYTPDFSEPLEDNTGYWQPPNPYEGSAEQVATAPTKKKKATRNRQKRMVQSENASRQTPWTMQEEVALCKGWLAVSENSQQGNSRKTSGFWCEVLSYLESKTGQYGKRTYDMAIGKWKSVRPAVIRFCGVYNNIMRMGPESGAGDEDYIQKALMHYEIETGIPFKLRHCWEILKDHPKWQEIAIPTFNTGSEGSSKRHKSSGSSSFNAESGEASINLNTNVGDNDEEDVPEIPQRPQGRDKAKAAGKKKGSKSSASASSSVNEDALAKLLVNEMGAQEKEERLAFLEIKRREVACRERELEQQDMRFYLQPYDHLTGDQRKAMDEIRAKIKAKYNLQY